ncbi:hypothetical protein FACS1894156_8750 [Bacteroidia bacterium]|nr:hypothetical protein FACS1894156_8750 [Bacteroidia bacterium]
METKTKNMATPQHQQENLSARDRIKPRGLAGILEGRIHYDENADIFNLH